MATENLTIEEIDGNVFRMSKDQVGCHRPCSASTDLTNPPPPHLVTDRSCSAVIIFPKTDPAQARGKHAPLTVDDDRIYGSHPPT